MCMYVVIENQLWTWVGCDVIVERSRNCGNNRVRVGVSVVWGGDGWIEVSCFRPSWVRAPYPSCLVIIK